jgi:hypothetical protein
MSARARAAPAPAAQDDADDIGDDGAAADVDQDEPKSLYWGTVPLNPAYEGHPNKYHLQTRATLGRLLLGDARGTHVELGRRAKKLTATYLSRKTPATFRAAQAATYATVLALYVAEGRLANRQLHLHVDVPRRDIQTSTRVMINAQRYTSKRGRGKNCDWLLVNVYPRLLALADGVGPEFHEALKVTGACARPDSHCPHAPPIATARPNFTCRRRRKRSRLPCGRATRPSVPRAARASIRAFPTG